METFLFVFPMILSGAFSAVTMNTRVHFHDKTKKTWKQAQSYCRKNYKDLSTVNSSEEHSRLEDVAGNSYEHSWIGLSRSTITRTNFVWSDGDLPTSFTKWKTGQPDGISTNQDCVEVVVDGWADFNCSWNLAFFCFKSTIMESDKKTWEEALGSCRQHYTDLASLSTSKEWNQVKSKITNEDFVWVGLRFLAGNWHWLNTDPLENPAALPECPVDPFRCGGWNAATQQWENRNCDDKYGFLCDWM